MMSVDAAAPGKGLLDDAATTGTSCVNILVVGLGMFSANPKTQFIGNASCIWGVCKDQARTNRRQYRSNIHMPTNSRII